MSTRVAWWFAVAIAAVVVVAATAPAAEACPCCGPCSKYDRMVPPEVEVAPLAEVYVRARPAALGRGRSGAVMKLLTTSTWRPRKAAPGVTPLALYDTQTIVGAGGYAPPAGARAVLVRNVIRRGGRVAVAIDRQLFQISPCRDRGRMTTCLVRLPEQLTADDLVPGGGDFAPPPPSVNQPAPGGE